MPEYIFLIGFIIAVLFAGVVGLIANSLRDDIRDTDKE